MSKVIYCVVGPSGAGKTTFCSLAKKEYPYDIKLIKSYTTRAPRYDSSDEYYRFIDEDDFLQLMGEGALFENVSYGGFHYGSAISELEDLGDGDIGLAIVTGDGVAPIRAAARKLGIIVYTIFLNIPKDEQRQRLLADKRSAKEIDVRTLMYDAEFEYCDSCDFMIYNVDNHMRLAYNTFIRCLGLMPS